MLKIPNKVSVWLSITISILFFLVCVGGVFFMPSLVDGLIGVRYAFNIFKPLEITNTFFILALAYAILVIAVLADALLFSLLLRVRAGKIFTPASVAHIRGVSWCCFLVAFIFCLIGLYFQITFAIAFVAVFIGLCLRVVKNVIEEATEIKTESDLTI